MTSSAIRTLLVFESSVTNPVDIKKGNMLYRHRNMEWHSTAMLTSSKTKNIPVNLILTDHLILLTRWCMRSQELWGNHLQTLLLSLLTPQWKLKALMKVSTPRDRSAWLMCSLLQAEWEFPTPVTQPALNYKQLGRKKRRQTKIEILLLRWFQLQRTFQFTGWHQTRLK